ncbi:hypothetical protein H4219_000436 [Mycoemilia scoparia]|uniref:UDP-galactose transporter n=1 Tax=Mycoemilia scoparia TaxID=417184 RepID=A0A9W8DXA2_9FUNG|nr:hypothetical protein H4219_000436 [Mycoemilia scoparia]
MSEEQEEADLHPEEPTLFGVQMKWISLGTLAIHNSILGIVLTYSRMESAKEPYLNSTAVFFSEAIKVAISFAMMIYTLDKRKCADEEQGVWATVCTTIKREVFGADAWKVSIPALLYTVQNNLQYIAAGNLDTATFQVTYQLKILTTALCSVILLKTVLNGTKWISLLMLTVGVAFTSVEKFTSQPEAETKSSMASQNVVTGLIAVLLACTSSGLSGVYFEKILKGTAPSLWVRNFQLSVFSLAIATTGILIFDSHAIIETGFLHGYTPWTWAAILCQATGGMVAAVVVKYANNILKGFATSIAIIISSVFSIWIFDFNPGSFFLSGSTLVVYATVLYGSSDTPEPEKKQATPI